jgi:outer membrane lipoprotein-sorting protein
MKRAWTASLLLVMGLVAMSGCAQRRESDAPTLADLVAYNTEARGGRAAIEAVQGLEIKLRISEPTYDADGLWRADRWGRMRVDVFMDGKRVWTEGYDGKFAWQLPGETEKAVLAGPGASALRHSAQLPTNLLGLHEMASHGHRLAYAGREEIDGVSYYAIVLTLNDGFTTRYYLDPESYLITRSRVNKALHPDVDPKPITIETVWSDFRQTGGVRMGFKATDTDLSTGKQIQTTTLCDVQSNPPLADALFEMPR